MFFFSLFSLFPDFVGLLLYSLVSVILLFLSILYFYATYEKLPFNGVLQRKEVQLTLAITGLQVLQGVVAAKIEVLMAAIMLFSIVRCMKGRYKIGSVLLGMILEWKFQALPIVGLVLTVKIVSEKKIRPLVYLVFSFFFWHYVPVLFIGESLRAHFMSHMGSALTAFISISFPNYDNIFKFLYSINLRVTFLQSMVISGAVGLILFCVVLRECLRRTLSPSIKYLFAMSMGSAFIIALSPMSQNNGSILWLPLLILAVEMVFHSANRWMKSISIALMILFCFSYSDLFPSILRNSLRHYSIKSVLILAYAFYVALFFYKAKLPEKFLLSLKKGSA